MILDLPTFVRAVCANRSSPHALLLGAGASISSGVQSAEACVWDWKRDIFVTNNPKVAEHFGDWSLPSVRARIQEWLDAQDCYPAADSPEQYSVFVEACYPIAEHRRQYFSHLVEGCRPGVGYHILCILTSGGLFDSVWTTNFDGLVPRAAAARGLTVIEVGLDSADRIDRSIAQGHLLHVCLHGDYRYDRLKNTAEEVRRQEARFHQELVRRLQRQSLVVMGYSGRDQSIMAALTAAVSALGAGNLFWCGYGSDDPSSEVVRLIRNARAAGREAYFVQTAGFDDTLLRVATHALQGEARETLRRLREEFAPEQQEPRRFEIPAKPPVTFIKSNALPLECPSDMFQFEAPALTGEDAWDKIRERVSGSRVVAAPLKGKVLALGLADDVRTVFGSDIRGPIERVPITGRDLARDRSVTQHLLTAALMIAVAELRNLAHDGRGMLWDAGHSQRRRIVGQAVDVYDAALLSLRQIRDDTFLVIKPTIRVVLPDGSPVSEELQKEAKREILGRQWNQPFNDAVNAWRNRILDGKARDVVGFPVGSESTFRFAVKKVPAAAKIVSVSSDRAQPLPGTVQKFAEQKGVHLDEPQLEFRSGSDSHRPVFDVHPLRGITNNRPFDHALAESGLLPDVRVGVICPPRIAAHIHQYLTKLHSPEQSTSKREYLLDYPGFSAAFNVPLRIPDPRDSAWQGIPEPPASATRDEGALFLRERIRHAIDSLVAAAPVTVIVLAIPNNWEAWEAFDEAGESFDLHDFFKAYCVEQGISTQFLREKTPRKPNQCEVLWWLGLSLFVKSGRTPFALAGMDERTAFVGLGFSLDRTAPRGKHVLVGCSHVYNADGRGLSFRLSRLEDAVLRRGNPFMSRDDARRMGEYTRQLFYERRSQLPHRVVIHRKTPFRRDEIEGLREGLSGVEEVEMLQISVEPRLRYVAASTDGRGVNRFPVRRGTAVVLENKTALLWVHGTADPVRPGLNPYYQGKSRIPAPLVVRRFQGCGELTQVASEILGLSKMNWNSFDLYTKLPATVDSSNTIARIGGLLSRFAPASYDYRLFI